jgi:coproporphyrinogen III oxidase-like Fe-S oxidoreductase
LTETDWQQSLEAAVAAGPDHISVYDLQVGAGMDGEVIMIMT